MHATKIIITTIIVLLKMNQRDPEIQKLKGSELVFTIMCAILRRQKVNWNRHRKILEKSKKRQRALSKWVIQRNCVKINGKDKRYIKKWCTFSQNLILISVYKP